MFSLYVAAPAPVGPPPLVSSAAQRKKFVDGLEGSLRRRGTNFLPRHWQRLPVTICLASPLQPVASGAALPRPRSRRTGRRLTPVQRSTCRICLKRSFDHCAALSESDQFYDCEIDFRNRNLREICPGLGKEWKATPFSVALASLKTNALWNEPVICTEWVKRAENLGGADWHFKGAALVPIDDLVQPPEQRFAPPRCCFCDIGDPACYK
jgi:hypothetical protein